MTAGAPLVALLLALLAIVALAAGTEAALSSLSSVDRKALARGDRTGRQVVWLLGRGQPLFATLLLARHGAAASVAAVAAGAWLSWSPSTAWAPVVLVAPLLLLVELAPRLLARRFHHAWSRLAAWPLSVAFRLLTPLRLLVWGVVTPVARLFGADGARAEPGMAEEELRVLLDRGAATGALDPMERDIIEAVFELDGLTVERLMTPRPDIFALPLSTGWDALLAQCRAAGRSRIPIYADRPDEIIGVLLLKDLLKHRGAPLSGPRQLRSLLLPPVFVPAFKSADAMLTEFLERKLHMAFVVDEHGAVVGLITLDDLLQELVGELDGDTEEPEIARITPRSLTVKASIDVDDFARETGITLPEGDYHTLGGFVFHSLGRLPHLGDAVTHEGHTFRVTAVEGRRIAEVAVDVGAVTSEEREALG